MRRAAFALTVVLVLLVSGLPVDAGAKQSTGLYAPFPSLSGSGYVRSYIGDFGLQVPRAQLDRGATISGGLAPSADASGSAPSARVAPGDHFTGGLLGGLLIALAGGGLLYRRRST